MRTRCQHCKKSAEIAKLSDGLCNNCIAQPISYLDTFKRIAESAPSATFFSMLSLLLLFTFPLLSQVLPSIEVKSSSVLSNIDVANYILVSGLIILVLSVQLLLTYLYRFFIVAQKVIWWKAFLISLIFGVLTILIVDITKLSSLLPTITFAANLITFPFLAYGVLRVTSLSAEEELSRRVIANKKKYSTAKTTIDNLNACHECRSTVGFFKLKDKLCSSCDQYKWSFFEYVDRLIKAMPEVLGIAIALLLMGGFSSELSISEYYSTYWIDLTAFLLPLLVAFIIRFYIARRRLSVLLAFVISIVLFINPSIAALLDRIFYIALPLFMLGTYKVLTIPNKAPV